MARAGEALHGCGAATDGLVLALRLQSGFQPHCFDGAHRRKEDDMSDNQASNEQPSEQREHLWSLIRDLRFAMFTTRHPTNGHLHSRPMTTQNKRLDEDDRLWFFMSRSSDTVEDLASDEHVNICYADTGKDTYVSVAGTAALCEDKAKARELWNKMNDAWFTGGVDDPDVALVEVIIDHAHYWDVKENKLTQLFKMAKAAVTGEQPSGMGESGEVRMHGDGR
jgi:general stress protein 26